MVTRYSYRKMDESSPNLDFKGYDALVKFRRTQKGEKLVSINIRYEKIGTVIGVQLPFPIGIKDSDLSWTKFGDEDIAVYHRKSRYRYVDTKHNIVLPTSGLGQTLEELVVRVYNRHLEIIKQKRQTK